MSGPGAGVIDVRPGMVVSDECFGRVDDPALVLSRVGAEPTRAVFSQQVAR